MVRENLKQNPIRLATNCVLELSWNNILYIFDRKSTSLKVFFLIFDLFNVFNNEKYGQLNALKKSWMEWCI